MNGLTFWECLAFTVLGGLGGFLLAYVVDPWLRNETQWDDRVLEDALEGSLEHPLEGVTKYGPVRPYDWERDAEV